MAIKYVERVDDHGAGFYRACRLPIVSCKRANIYSKEVEGHLSNRNKHVGGVQAEA